MISIEAPSETGSVIHLDFGITVSLTATAIPFFVGSIPSFSSNSPKVSSTLLVDGVMFVESISMIFCSPLMINFSEFAVIGKVYLLPNFYVSFQPLSRESKILLFQ